MSEKCQHTENVADLGIFFIVFRYVHFMMMWNTFLMEKFLHNGHATSVSLTFLLQLQHISPLSLVFSMLDLPAMSYFISFFSFFLFFLSNIASSSFFLFSFSWNKAFHAVHVTSNGILSVFLLNFFCCVWLLQNFLVVRNVFFIKPVFWSCMYGCTCARMFIQSAWSNLCHVKIKCLFVFVPDLYFLILFYYTLATWKFYLMVFLVMHHSVCWVHVLPHFSITFFELCYKLTFHNFFKCFVCFGHTSVTRSSLCDFRWYSFVWIYQYGWAHHSRSREWTWLLWSVLQGVCQLHKHFCSLCMLRLFQSLGRNGNLIYHCWKFWLGPEKCPAIFLVLKHFQPPEAYNCKKKNMLYWKALAT